MKCAIVFTAVFALLSLRSASCGYTTDIDAIMRDLAVYDIAKQMACTNRIDALKASTSDLREKATCRLVKAALLLKLGDDMLDYSAWDCATNEFHSLESDLAATPDAWQLHCSRLFTAGALILDGKYGAAFDVLSDALAKLDAQQTIALETNVWNAINIDAPDPHISMRDAMRADAAHCLFRAGRFSELSTYTNGLNEATLRDVLR